MNTQVALWGQTLSFTDILKHWYFCQLENQKANCRQTAQLHVLKQPLLFYVLPECFSVTNTEDSRATEELLATVGNF